MGLKCTKLTPDDYKDILKGDKFTKQEIEQWFEKFKKEFPKGKMSKYGFLSTYTNLFPDGDATQFTEHIFRTYDMDGNGFIEFREFMTTIGIAQRGSMEEKMKWAFRLYDMDGNGKLTLKEIESVLEALYKAKNESNPVEKAKQSAKEFLFDLDTNHDGFVSEDEFVEQLGKCPSLRQLLEGY